jgi:hypothetical protein
MSTNIDLQYEYNISEQDKSSVSFFIYYYLSLFISLIFLYTIRVQKYKNDEGREDIKIKNYLQTLKMCSPYQIIDYQIYDKEYIGFTANSYFFIIFFYAISLLVIIYNFANNYLFNIITSSIQSNKNNNPYKNPNMVTKSNTDNSTEVIKNNSKIFGYLLIFFVPFLIPHFLKLFKLDNYDVKTNIIVKSIIFILLFFPFIFVINLLFFKNINIIKKINTFLETKDYEYNKKIEKQNIITSFPIYYFILIIFIFSFYYIMKLSINNNNLINIIIAILLLFVIPYIIYKNVLCTQLANFNTKLFDSSNITKYLSGGIKDMLSLIIKYNYPCIKK